MSIPYNDNLSWNSYQRNLGQSEIPKDPLETEPSLKTAPSMGRKALMSRAVNELGVQLSKQSVKRGIQFIRDAARLVLKVPIRSIWTPIVLKKNWKQRERAKINAKLAGYSFVQLVSVPAKFLVAFVALAASAVSFDKAKQLLDKSESWTTEIDGRTSRLEALKEVGRKESKDLDEYNKYKTWLYSIDSKRCRKM